VELADLVEDADSGTIIARINAWHSDFGSRKLNLWKISIVSKEIIFQGIYLYDHGP
jgi:hypothetical protein